jgi:uncharacterized membrane protein YvbJ
MFCRHCGSELKDKAVVCSNCGAGVEEGGETLSVATPKWSWFTMFVTVGILFILLLVAIIAGL